jgi:hypothetical protein
MSELTLKPVWRMHNPEVAAQVLALWRRLDAVPPDLAEARIKELCAVACQGDQVVGIATVAVDDVPQLGCRFGFFRCLVDPAHRERDIARRLAVYSRDLLAAWSQGNPAEKVMGLAAVVESPNLEAISKLPVWPASRLTLAGYNDRGNQVRIVWFEHASLGARRDAARSEEDLAADIVTVWRKDDPDIVSHATALWDRLGVLPQGVSAQNRAAQLCGAAFIDGALAGVSTIALGVLPQLKTRFGFFRCLVVPELRQRHLARKLAVHARHTIADWSKENPQEKVLGMVSVVENPKLVETCRQPVWSAPGIENGLMLIGHSLRGHQIRVSWFEHARLD